MKRRFQEHKRNVIDIYTPSSQWKAKSHHLGSLVVVVLDLRPATRKNITCNPVQFDLRGVVAVHPSMPNPKSLLRTSAITCPMHQAYKQTRAPPTNQPTTTSLPALPEPKA